MWKILYIPLPSNEVVFDQYTHCTLVIMRSVVLLDWGGRLLTAACNAPSVVEMVVGGPTPQRLLRGFPRSQHFKRFLDFKFSPCSICSMFSFG